MCLAYIWLCQFSANSYKDAIMHGKRDTKMRVNVETNNKINTRNGRKCTLPPLHTELLTEKISTLTAPFSDVCASLTACRKKSETSPIPQLTYSRKHSTTSQLQFRTN